ncbi:MAG TPA: allantoicase [Nocardioidaceae bacterium]|nr:allantoicase [Nocardioidaceae bacterium]
MSAQSSKQGTPSAVGTEFAGCVDLAARGLGAGVVAASDDLFAERENLIAPGRPVFDPTRFGPRGKVYDGWETARRRDGGHDFAVVRLGTPGIVQGVVVDTSWFRGNYPPYVSAEAAWVDGYPSPGELLASDWQTIVARSPASGDTENVYRVDDGRRWSHVRLSIYPDGGVARLRVPGLVVADPRFLEGTVDLLAVENGGRAVECSDAFYAAPQNLIAPGRARHMGEGWETARRRDAGNDFVVFALAGQGVVRHLEVDTTWFVGNAPGWVRVSTADDPAGEWRELVPRMAVRPDTRHRLLTPDAHPATHLRLDVYPDGGLSRLRAWGELTPTGLAAAQARWIATAAR